GFFVAPYLIERNLPAFAQERLGRKASVEKVRINPYALTFEASGFFLEDKGDKRLLAFKRLYVNLQLSSIFRGWTFDEVRLEGASLGLEIDRELRLNLLEVIRRLLKAPKPDDPAARVLVSKLVVADGRVEITDLSGASRANAAFEPINFELSNLSTLADQEGRFNLDARLPAGGTLAWKGRLSLEPIASAGELSIRGLKLENAWRFRRPGWNIARPGGSLSIGGHYALDYQPGHATLLLDRVQAELVDLSLAAAEKEEPALVLRSIKVSDASLAYPKGELVVNKLVFSDGLVNATVSDTGVLNWQRMAAPTNAEPAAPAVQPAPASPVQPWRIQLSSVAVENVAVNYVDRSRKPALALRTKALNAGFDLDIASGAEPAQVVIDNLALALDAITATVPDSATRFATLDTLKVDGGRIDVRKRQIRANRFELSRGDLTLAMGPQGPEGLIKALSSDPAAHPEPETASPPWRVQVDKIGIEKLAVQYEDKSRAPGYAVRAGELNVGFGLDVSTGGKDARTLATDLQLGIDQLRLNAQGTDAPLASLDSFRLTSGTIDTGKRTASAKAMGLSGGGVRVVRGPDGSFALMNVFGSNAASIEPAARTSKTGAASPTWRYRVDAIDLKRFGVALADATFTPAIAYDVEIASLTANNVDAAGRKPIAFTAALRLGKEGAASGEGTLRQDFSGASAQLELTRFPLQPLQPILARHAVLDLKSGQLAGKARVTYARGRKPEVVARGQLALADVLINEAGTNERFASWKTLAIDGADLSLSPDKLTIKEVRVIEPQAKIIIARDRSVNLTKIVRNGEGARTASAGVKRAAPPTQAATGDAQAFAYDLETIRVDKGVLDFADLSLVLPFATQVQALNGAIVGVSSDPNVRARIQLAGQVDKYGEARADGALIPRDTAKFMDITARFDNVDMGSLSPYSATFAGRKIAEGRLNLVLEYKIVNSQLAGENRIVLRDFKLGERVDAPGASNLPLDLAVALLKDSDGRITLAIPVRGNVDDPKFDYGKVIWSAIANVLTRIVTAPFRALGSLFAKGDSDAGGSVSFAPGSASISPSQREQLDRLTKALQSRPQLKLVVKGPYDPAKDARELKRAEARLELARTLGTKLRPGQEPGPVAFESAETQRALEKLLVQRGGPDALAELEKSFARRTGRQPDRVNPVLGLIGRASKDGEFYEAVYERLVDVIPLPEGAVRALAEKRAQAIIATLEKAGINKAQVSSGGVAQVQAHAEKGVTTQLALEAIAGTT
ncbi:MAG TPA: DUF748 domain-containing protein, partial [Burkholderiales bacterium]|nr:DUF748 domain-containing protein [Burkholderiales bacterium]